MCARANVKTETRSRTSASSASSRGVYVCVCARPRACKEGDSVRNERVVGAVEASPALGPPFLDDHLSASGHLSASLSLTISLPFLDGSSVRVVFKGCSRPAVSQWIGFVRVVGGCSRPAGGCLRLSSTRTPRNRTVWSVASVGSRAPSRRLRRPSRRLCRPSRRLCRPSRRLRPSVSSESPSASSESP